MSANQPTAAWSGPGDPLVVVAGHLVSPEDGFGEIGRMPNGNLRRPIRASIGAQGVRTIGILESTRFNTFSRIELRRANGTEEIPSAVLSGEELGRFGVLGHDGTAFGNAGAIRSIAAENWAVGAHGASLQFRTVAIGATAFSNRWDIQAAGHLVAATDGLIDIGQVGANRPRNLDITGVANIGAALNVLNGNLAVTRTGTGPRFLIIEGSAAADNQIWDVTANSEVLSFRAVDDAQTGTEAWLSVQRTAEVIDSVTIPNGDFIIADLSASAISVGVNDSGGAGFKLLRVPN